MKLNEFLIPLAFLALSVTPCICAYADAPSTKKSEPHATVVECKKKLTYPYEARRARETGTVKVRVHVLEDGNQDTVEIAQTSGFERLDMAVKTWAASCRFKPVEKNGVAAADWTTLSFTFNVD